jgi:hypothetical protein
MSAHAIDRARQRYGVSLSFNDIDTGPASWPAGPPPPSPRIEATPRPVCMRPRERHARSESPGRVGPWKSRPDRERPPISCIRIDRISMT